MSRYLFGLLVLMLGLAACRGDAEEERPIGGLRVDQVTAVLSLPSETGAIYMRIHNGTGQDEALTGAVVPGCEAVELHEMRMDGDMMLMRQVEGNRIVIPRGETVMLQRAGLHIMCIGKTVEFAVGDAVSVTLQFEGAGAVEVTAEVIDPAEVPMEMDGEH